jgi:predicted CoA-substrate-specific enzyme activase
VKCLGIDIGSTTCKLVVIDDNNDILEKCIAVISGEPIMVVTELLKGISTPEADIELIGVTGSARNLIGKYLGASLIKSEIIAHAYATIHAYKAVGTIIEIGGQDSKYIKLGNNIIEEFRINSVCAAGTGSFLEWQAKRLGVTVEQFDELALQSKNAVKINGKCAVFLESAIINLLRIGESKADIANAIAMVIAQNYINELCKNELLNTPIIFQGGVARSGSVKNALEKILQQRIIKADNCEYMGAYGIALLARRNCPRSGNDRRTRIRKWDLQKIAKAVETCDGCERRCELVKYQDLESGAYFHVGGRCGRY